MPYSVEVVPRKTAAVVAVDHSIWVQHRDDFEDEVLTNSFRVLCFGGQEVYEALAYEGRGGLAWVDSAGDEDGFFLLFGLKIGDSQQVHIVAAGRFCQGLSLDDSFQ